MLDNPRIVQMKAGTLTHGWGDTVYKNGSGSTSDLRLDGYEVSCPLYTPYFMIEEDKQMIIIVHVFGLVYSTVILFLPQLLCAI